MLFLLGILLAVQVPLLEAVAGLSVPEQNFYLEISSESAPREWFRIYRQGKLWICQTDVKPYFEARRNPLENLNWKLLEKPTENRSPCRDQVLIQDRLQTPARTTRGCFSESRFNQLVYELYQACKR